MAKIRDIVQINSGYTSYVDLYEDYYDLAKNRGRMERYKPIAAHRAVFERIANALNPKDRRFYFLSGSYGTGKSHLLLMLANYFANPSDVPEVEAFFSNYETAQNEVLLKPGEVLKERKAESLKQARKSGRYLIALCRFDLNLDFEGALLRALTDALEKDECKALLDTAYREAVRRVQDWEARRDSARFYTDLQSALSRRYPDWTINDLMDGLTAYDDQAMEAFKACFRDVTDTEFSYSKDNLRDIISDLLKSQDFKDTYRGIVFLYDEFGDAIDHNLVPYNTMLGMAQFCANSTLEKGGAVIFIGTGHKAFRSHGKVGDLNAETLEARVSEIGLQTQGMEDIIAAIVQPRREDPAWSTVEAQSGKFTWFSSECSRLHLFSWLPAPKIKNNIIQNIYPMHPLATYALLKLAGEAGSDNRSVFKFFAPEFETGEQGWLNVQPYSYPWFVEHHDIEEQDQLALYTADYLVDYFRESLKVTNTRLTDSVKSAVANYEATLRELNAYLAKRFQERLFEDADELMFRIIKVILVNEICSSQEAPIANTVENIEFALDAVSPEHKTLVSSRLDLLSKAGVLYNNKGVYELTRSDRKDIQRLVDQFKANPDNHLSNVLVAFLEASPLKTSELYQEAKEYNTAFNEDKRLKVVFATPEMLTAQRQVGGVPFPFYTALEEERKQGSGTSGYEGTLVYVFCEHENDIDLARQAAAKNDQPRVLLAIPQAPIPVHDAVFTLRALESDAFKAQTREFGPLERVEEKGIRDTATEGIEQAKQAYLASAKMLWFGAQGVEIAVPAGKPRDAVTQVMHSLYGARRNTFPHTEFNKAHLNISGQVRTVLIEAANALCDLTQPLHVNWSWADNRGGTRYLRKCFVDQQALKIVGQEGDVRYLEPEKDTSKFRAKLPAYARMLEDLAKLEGQGPTNLLQFLRPYLEEYGQGEIAVTLTLLLARRLYRDGLRFKREPNTLTDLAFLSADALLDLVQGKSPAAVMLVEPVSDEDQAYFGEVAQTYAGQPAEAGKVYSIADAFQAITGWWGGLPVIARSLVFYDQSDRSIAEALAQAKTKDPYRFIKHDLLALFGCASEGSLSAAALAPLEERLRGFKGVAEAVQSTVEERILKVVAKTFGAESSLDVDIQEALTNWHHGLSATQKDPLGSFHNNDSKPLVKFTSYTAIRDLLFQKLPTAYALGNVSDWTADHVETYVSRLASGKAHIETQAPQVGALKVEFDCGAPKGNQITYKGELVLHADTEDGKGVIYYTDDGSDPQTSNRRQVLKPGDMVTIRGNRSLKLVVADEKGVYSAVQTYKAIDELAKYVIQRPVQTAFEEAVTFVFPPTREAAQITVESLMVALKESEIYSGDELQQAIQNAIDACL